VVGDSLPEMPETIKSWSNINSFLQVIKNQVVLPVTKRLLRVPIKNRVGAFPEFTVTNSSYEISPISRKAGIGFRHKS